mmetsp:Transcript_20410/g.58183  ORF Transcript_20410/g.58183 Transcript_20410/m.58183 type:complete len:253 (-) Transcript_20410:183-941(-)
MKLAQVIVPLAIRILVLADKRKAERLWCVLLRFHVVVVCLEQKLAGNPALKHGVQDPWVPLARVQHGGMVHLMGRQKRRQVFEALHDEVERKEVKPLALVRRNESVDELLKLEFEHRDVLPDWAVAIRAIRLAEDIDVERLELFRVLVVACHHDVNAGLPQLKPVGIIVVEVTWSHERRCELLHGALASRTVLSLWQRIDERLKDPSLKVGELELVAHGFQAAIRLIRVARVNGQGQVSDPLLEGGSLRVDG